MPQRFLPILLALAALVGTASAADAQRRPRAPESAESERGRAERDREPPRIPREYMPPAGMCRIWLDDVPPKQQPAPTDCPTAIRKRPPNGHVIFGKKSDDDDGPAMKLRKELRGSEPPPVRIRWPGLPG